MLMNQHVLLFEPDAVQNKRRVGIIDLKCNVAAVLKQAYEEASILCEQNYDITPEMHVSVHEQFKLPATEEGRILSPEEIKPDLPPPRLIIKERTKGPIFLVYPPQHMKHILHELLKNAMRASIELTRNRGALQVPDINVLITKGTEDVSIKISDKVRTSELGKREHAKANYCFPSLF